VLGGGREGSGGGSGYAGKGRRVGIRSSGTGSIAPTHPAFWTALGGVRRVRGVCRFRDCPGIALGVGDYGGGSVSLREVCGDGWILAVLSGSECALVSLGVVGG
jgi:hypothetical protein